MQSTDIPVKIQLPFATAAPGPNVNYPLPVPSQIGILGGAASWTDGFPPVTFTPTTAGGIPPFGKDFNGVFRQISGWSRWFAAGAPIIYDSTFQGQIGGYPQGTIVQSATTLGLFWFSVAENNTTNPDTGGAGWIGFSMLGVAPQDITASGVFTILRNSCRLIRTASLAPSSTTLPAGTAIVDGYVQWISDAIGNFRGFPVTVNANSGQTIGGGLTAATLNVDGQVARFEWVKSASTWTVRL